MKILISEPDLYSRNSRDNIPLECLTCGNTHYRTKNIVLSILNGNKQNTLNGCFCSNRCFNSHRTKSKEYLCKECGRKIQRSPSQIRSDEIFCSRSCSAKFQNKSNIIMVKCINCNATFNPKNGTKNNRGKCCSNKCQHEYRRKVLYDNIDAGHYTINFPNNSTLKKYLLFRRGHRCEEYNLTLWKHIEIPLTVHHKDGNALNNIPSNLQLLCWNCHALTENYGRKNKTSARTTRYKKMEHLTGDDPALLSLATTRFSN